MNAQEFCYWLQGKLEIDGEPKALTKEQMQIIKDHLQLVFTKVTPDRVEPDLKKVMEDMKKVPSFPPFAPNNWPDDNTFIGC